MALQLVACGRSVLRQALPQSSDGPAVAASLPGASGATGIEATIEEPNSEGSEQPPGSAADIASVDLERSAPADLWDRLRRNYQLEHPLNPRIEKELQRLTRSPHRIESLLGRGKLYFHLILEQVEQRGLPAELVFLPAVESAYRPTAHSYSGAAGLWQIMPATGRRAGLRLDEWYDGRRDIFDSTNAALGLLEHLHGRFDGDWLHALAAYNAGPSRLSRAIRRNAAKDLSTEFWDLDLPRETDTYVPRLLAIAEIVAQPELYGVDLPEVPDKPRLHRVNVSERTDLRVAARISELDKEHLLRLNAGFKALATLPDGPHWIVVPVDASERLSEGLASLDSDARLPADELNHRIQRGETLGGIARRYGVSVKSLKRANHLRGSRIRAGSTLIIPGRLQEPLQVARLDIDSSVPAKPQGRIRHRVRRGDSLYLIARRYQVSISELRRWNDIQGKLIKPGQQLTVFVPESTLSL